MEQALGSWQFRVERESRTGTASPDEQFAEMVGRKSAFLFRVAFAVLRNAHDAEDAVQESFLKLYRNGSWRGIDDEQAFLARVTWRMAVSRLKRTASADLDPALASAEPGPESLAIEANWTEVVLRLIDALPEEVRQPLVLSSLEEMDSKRIAAIMDIPEGTVRTRIMRARNILKEKLRAMKEGRHGQSAGN